MKLEEQIATLASLGLHLNEGITVDDFLLSFDRDDYEDTPFDVILFVYGIEVENEPWGRFFCDRVWNFDTECIVTHGNYVRIIKRLCTLSGDDTYLKDIKDSIDYGARKADLEYTVNGKHRIYDAEFNNDWADVLALTYVMNDIERDGRKFYAIENGQSLILFYISEETATQLNRLSKDELYPMVL